MNKTRIQFTLIALGILSCSPVFGDVDLERPPTPIPKTISFDEALNHALANSPTVRKSQAMLELATQEWIRARGEFLPKLDLLSTNQEIEALGNIPGLESLLLSGRKRVQSANTALRLSLNAYSGGESTASLELADEAIQTAKLDVLLQRSTLASIVLDHVHALRIAEIDLRVAEIQLAMNKKKLEQAGNSLSIGRLSDLAFAEANYDYKSNDLARTMKIRNRENALQNVLIAIGWKDAPPELNHTGSVLEAYDEVIARHDLAPPINGFEVQIAESKVRQTQIELDRAQSGFKPRVDLFATRTFAGLSESGSEQAFKDQGVDKKIIGFTLSWNIFDGLATTASVRGVDQKILGALADQEIAQREQEKQLDELNRALKDSEGSLELETQRLALLEMKMDISREKLALGLLDETEMEVETAKLETQKLEVSRRSEIQIYHRTKLRLRQGNP